MNKKGIVKCAFCPHCSKKRLHIIKDLDGQDIWVCKKCPNIYTQNWFDTFFTFESKLLRYGEDVFKWKEINEEVGGWQNTTISV